MAGYIGSKTSVAQVDGYTRTEADAGFVSVAGDTMTGGLTVGGSFTSLGIDDNATATAVTIDASGNVGIGTATPSTALEVSTAAISNNLRVSSTSGTRYGEVYTDTNGVMILSADVDATGSAPNLRFRVSGTERMRIDGSGNLLVGTSVAGGNKTHIGFDNSVENGMRFSHASATYTKPSIIFVNQVGSQVGSIKSTGTATSYITTSDYRLKENVTLIQGAGDIVKAMRPVTYTYKSDGSWMDGFLAHELQELHPRAVTGSKDAVDEEGNPEYQGVDYSKLTPILTAALQEALNKIDALEARLTALEATP